MDLRKLAAVALPATPHEADLDLRYASRDGAACAEFS